MPWLRYIFVFVFYSHEKSKGIILHGNKYRIGLNTTPLLNTTPPLENNNKNFQNDQILMKSILLQPEKYTNIKCDA